MPKPLMDAEESKTNNLWTLLNRVIKANTIIQH